MLFVQVLDWSMYLMVNVVTTLLITVLYGTLKWIIVKHPALSIVCHMANHQYAFLFE